MSSISATKVTRVNAHAQDYVHHNLYIADKQVLSFGMPIDGMDFPPDLEVVIGLNAIVHDLARAVRSVEFQADNDSNEDAVVMMHRVVGLCDAIVIINQLSTAAAEHIKAVGEKS